MNPGDRMVVAFIEPHTVGDVFAHWPLHLTIVPWFRTGASTPELVEEWNGVLTGIAPFEALGQGEARFGAHRKLVDLIAEPSPVGKVEQRIRAELKKRSAWLVDESTSQQQMYRPHVTAQGAQRLGQGNRFMVYRLFVVEQKGDHKEVVGEVYLHD